MKGTSKISRRFFSEKHKKYLTSQITYVILIVYSKLKLEEL